MNVRNRTRLIIGKAADAVPAERIGSIQRRLIALVKMIRALFVNILHPSGRCTPRRQQSSCDVGMHFKIQNAVGHRQSQLAEFKIPQPVKKVCPHLTRQLGQLVHGVCRGVSVGDDDGIGIGKIAAPVGTKRDIAVNGEERRCGIRVGILGIVAERTAQIQLYRNRAFFPVHRKGQLAHAKAAFPQRRTQKCRLRFLARGIQTVNGDQSSHQMISSCFKTSSIYCSLVISTRRGFCPSGADT